jgi:hypothetical protein
MPILHSLLVELKAEFSDSEKGKERSVWFLHTLLAIILPFTSSKTSNLLRVFRVLFGFAEIGRKRYYTFIASPKIPWDRLWPRVWKMIPQPQTKGRLLVALDDYLNPKTGKKIFGCARMFDHAAKQNQSRYPWAQNVVAIGLLKVIKGRWACLPLSHRYYFSKDDISNNQPTFKGKQIAFQNKHQQAVEMLAVVAREFPQQQILVVADSWFGNQGLWKPLRKTLGKSAHLLSRLRANNNLYGLPDRSPLKKRAGRPTKYGKHLGTTTSLAKANRDRAEEMVVNLYGKKRPVLFSQCIVMQKTLKCPIRVVWVYRRTQWVALFTTDLSLSVTEIIEYYGARWKIEAGFKELKQDIGSAETQNRHPVAVQNHLNLCMMATSITWVYACHLNKTPSRRHAVRGRSHFAFSDVRRLIAQEALDEDFQLVCPLPRKPSENTFAAAFMRLAA